MIRAFDGYGREMFISKQQWRENVLPESLKKVWNQPDELYSIILAALNDGFRPDVIDAAKRLYKIDPNQARGTCVCGIVLTEEGRVDEAREIFSDYMAKRGEDGIVLTDLAKALAKQNENAKAEEILWHALELDPNQDNGLGWYEAIHRERRGEAAGHDALLRVSGLPAAGVRSSGSRAQH